jgi:hypothetical protein
MKSGKIFFSCLFMASYLLSSCQVATDIKQETQSISPSPIILSPSPTGKTLSPTILPSSTHIPCNPTSMDFCITKGTLLLLRPIAFPGMQLVDRSYAYGSTGNGERIPHHGVEFYNASGTPVLAAADGMVVYASDDAVNKFSPWLDFYGNLIILEHNLPDPKIYTLYAHLSKVNVSVGQSISAGSEIGEVGASGSAIGSHLHFEVRSDPQDYNSTLNPELWLIPTSETGVLAMRFVDINGGFIHVQSNVQFYPDPSKAFTQAWQPETYSPDISVGAWENAVLGDLPIGQYRITYLWAGILYERWVEVQPMLLTLVSFEVP